MDKMLNTHSRRRVPVPRPRTLILLALASITTYFLLFSGPSSQLRHVPYLREKGQYPITPADETSLAGGSGSESASNYFEKEVVDDSSKMMGFEFDISLEELRAWKDPTDREDPKDVLPGYETDGRTREPGDISRLQHEKDLRKMWRYAYKMTEDLPSTGLIYGNTIKSLDHKNERPERLDSVLREDPTAEFPFSDDRPVRFNPYRDYNSDDWKKQGYAPYVPCNGASGELVEDLLVFKGRPSNWPEPKIGSYKVMDMDPNLCWERETRLGAYGLTEQMKKVGGESEPIDWYNVNWGDLQRRCVHKNAKRFDVNRVRENEYMNAYPDLVSKLEKAKAAQAKNNVVPLRDYYVDPDITERSSAFDSSESGTAPNSGYKTEKQTAILLRSYTGKTYTENDKQVIRAMISELSLKSGGEYQVFLLVHVKNRKLRIFDDPETYQAVLQDNIPPEFHGITVLWNDEVVWNIYTELNDDNEKSVHTAQWLSVQKFSHDHPQFDYIWNWEMDFRYTGHHYDLLNKMSNFAKKQPRRGLWERNERWYIPSYHGDYDTTFRKDVEQRMGNNTVWGPLNLTFVNPVGPKPPAETPEEDDYIWGVGEDADVITVGPMFNPVDSQWIITRHVWGYTDAHHHSWDVPRRTTIVTQSRVSKRLLDIMHVENMRGNHVASEMTPQTVALHHGFKAVFAPHPVFMDRDWEGDFINDWFNSGDLGQCGGRGSPMGWGRERRYQGNTWYYRAEPPNRLYNNWMGWIDTGLGGARWEARHGRPCLPSVMLHPVKDSEMTSRNHETGFDLAYG